MLYTVYLKDEACVRHGHPLVVSSSRKNAACFFVMVQEFLCDGLGLDYLQMMREMEKAGPYNMVL